MLWKLLKYDFRSMWKQFSIIWPAALVIALINRFTLDGRYSTSDVGGTTSVIMLSLFIGVLIAMFVASMIFILRRFYQGLLGDEGYLMHTLPVKSWQLVASKLVCALFVTVANSVVAGLSMLLLFPFDWSELFRFDLWQAILDGLAEHPDTLLYLLEFCLLMLAALALAVTMLYLSMAVGHLFSRRRVLMSVVAFFAINILCQWVTEITDLFSLADPLAMGGQDHAAFLVYLALVLIPTALFFWGTSYILKNRLNLE